MDAHLGTEVHKGVAEIAGRAAEGTAGIGTAKRVGRMEDAESDGRGRGEGGSGERREGGRGGRREGLHLDTDVLQERRKRSNYIGVNVVEGGSVGGDCRQFFAALDLGDADRLVSVGPWETGAYGTTKRF